MKKKIGTVLDETLVLKVKQVALAKKRNFSQILEEALRNYFAQIERREKDKRIALITKGSMRISKKVLKQIMEEEGVYESW